MARMTYVPLHSIIVVRDNKQVDALEEYKATGKAFKFEQSELDEIAATNGGDTSLSLRSPTDEAADDEAGKMSPGTDDAATGKPVAKPGKSKDEDL